MTHFIRLSLVSLALAAACSGSQAPALSDDLKHDLAAVGGSDMQLAGSAGSRVDVVSASERTKSPAPAPRAPAVSRVASTAKAHKAPARSVRHETPVAAEPVVRAEEAAPAEPQRTEQREPEPVPAARGRPEAPRPSTQREPPGGWRTPGQVIRNAPFPINP